MVEKLKLAELDQRTGQLEALARSLFRALETYVTVSDLLAERGTENVHLTQETKTLQD